VEETATERKKVSKKKRQQEKETARKRDRITCGIQGYIAQCIRLRNTARPNGGKDSDRNEREISC